MRAALLQMTSGDDPEANLRTVCQMLAEAKIQGAEFALTPEVTNCVSFSRTHQARVLQSEADDIVLRGTRKAAQELGIWVLLGSIAVKSAAPETRFANRSVLISADGVVVATYDKTHMFDVTVSDTETYRESAGYAPGDRAVVAKMMSAKIGLSICYDIRFAYLYRKLAQAGAHILTAPAAFSPTTGPAHWEPLLRARAIETGSFVLAPAQTGDHPVSRGRPRRTYGHSMVVSPWGEVLLDAGRDPGVYTVDLDLSTVNEARRKIPALTHDRDITGRQ